MDDSHLNRLAGVVLGLWHVWNANDEVELWDCGYRIYFTLTKWVHYLLEINSLVLDDRSRKQDLTLRCSCGDRTE